MFKTCCVDQQDLVVNVHAPESIWSRNFRYRINYVREEDGSFSTDACFLCDIFDRGKRE